jgi:hypothetical protein
MDTVTILRRLWRFRLLVVLSASLAIVLGCLVVYRYSPPLSLESRKYEVGVATARILVDTPASQVVDVAPKGSDVLGGRATLLANLMVEGEIKTAIAKRAGLPIEKLVGVSDSGAITGGPADAPPDPRGYQIGTHVLTTSGGDSLPIIQVDAQGPDAMAAQHLANAAVEGLREYLDSKAAIDRVPDAQRLRVSGLGVAQSRLAVRGPRLAYVIAAAIFVFGFACAAILLISALVGALRAPAQTAGPQEAEFDPDADPFDPRVDAAARAWDVSKADLVAPKPVNGANHVPDEPSEVAETPNRSKSPSPWWGDGPT